MTNSIIKLLLISDYSIFRSALRMILETDKELRVIAEANYAELESHIISEELPDLIVVDLPDFGGTSLLRFFEGVRVPVVVLVGQRDKDLHHRCLRSGIAGVIPKEASADTLFKAIRKVNDGEIWFDRSVMGDTIRQLLVETQSMRDFPKAHVANALTEREHQVVELICKGMKNKEIGDRLFISETTVRHHLSSIFGKLKITSRLELVVYSYKNNLVSKPEGESYSRRNGQSAITAASTIA